MRNGVSVLAILLWAALPAMAQELTERHYTKLVVPSKKTFRILIDSVQLDTLVMEDNSKLRFDLPETILLAENVFVGRNCLWDASGAPGNNAEKSSVEVSKDGTGGGDGTNGNSITSIVFLHSLGNLTIRTRGGKGGSGKNGAAGVSDRGPTPTTTDQKRGGDGGPGGNGGQGGNITFYYATAGFQVAFNDTRQNSVAFDFAGGTGGRGGQGGLGGDIGKTAMPKYEYPQKAQRGASGPSGKDGNNGALFLERLK
ncbi:MAG: hypothetical protein SH819_00965 [Cytophagales bacterium]|nr:hypothetical protein [Cytophagales bacterium]